LFAYLVQSAGDLTSINGQSRKLTAAAHHAELLAHDKHRWNAENKNNLFGHRYFRCISSHDAFLKNADILVNKLHKISLSIRPDCRIILICH